MTLFEKIIDMCAFVISVIIGIVLMPLVIDNSISNCESTNCGASFYTDDRDPKLILQQRYARGEINSLEYLERMIRL